MSFVSIDFALLLLATLAIYPWLSRVWQNALLLTASYIFYGAWDWRFVPLLCFTTTVDWLVAHRIAAARDAGEPALAKRWLRVSLFVNLGALAFFKYFNFFIDEGYAALARLGVEAHKPTLEILLPLGISFHTFQTLSHSIEVHRGHLKPSRSWLDFAAFIAFFPQMVAGPIERATHMLPQFQRERRVTDTDIAEGLWLILIGYFRKMVVADTAASLIASRFEKPGTFDAMELLCGLLLFTIQIYGDFAGYSDIARGTARLFGFELMKNFERPYFARNISEFWRRWHISLSTWLRDYLYVSLGGNRRGELRTYVNLMTTMVLGGLWHGASWNFVIWGALHGAYLCIHRAVRPVLERVTSGASAAAALVGRVLATLLTFACVAFTWLFFRSTSFELTQKYLEGLTRWDGVAFSPLLSVIALAALMLLIDVPQSAAQRDTPMVGWPRLVRLPLAAAMLTLLCLSQDSGEPFIYFQF